MNTKHLSLVLAILLGALASGQGQAQTIFSEDFTGAGTTNSWYFFNGACLTAGTATSTSSPGPIPGCQTVWSNYYSTAPDKDPYLFGGNSGFLGLSTAPSSGSSQTRDPVGSGALRFSNAGSSANGKTAYGGQERGAIISATPTPTGQGIQLTFKTVTYGGDSGGQDGASDGADGISFFLINPSLLPNGITTGSTGVPTAVGATGGSLGYSCSNSNGPPQGVTYDGLTGAYIGLGIDEFGNFLNGVNLGPNAADTPPYTGTNVASGDNTAFGYGIKPNRIGLRGAGSISWAALNAAYGTYQGSGLPYYPASLATTFGSSTYSCGSGTSNNNNEFCFSCPSAASFPGAPTNATGVVTSSPTTCTDTLYNSVSTCPAATSYTSYSGAPSTPAGTISFNGTNCIDTLYSSASTCPTSNTAYSGAPSIGTIGFSSGHCTDAVSVTNSHGHTTTTTFTGPATATYTGPATTVLTTAPSTGAVTVTGGSGTSLAEAAVQQACSTGNLYNYYDPAAPTFVTTATLSASGTPTAANPKGILDYAPIQNAFKEITAFTIANESATTRSQATPIFYNLKITQDGLLSLSYSTGGAFSSIIQNQNITTSNGPLPPTFLFGFSGSTGGSTNIHEIMCFKAASATTAGSSAAVNQVQASKLEAGTQAYFAFYNPNDWTGTITANGLSVNTAGAITVNTQANWDAQCTLTGTTGSASAGGGCASTQVSGTIPANPAPASRVMLTWDTTNNVGISFEWASLNANQQTVLDAENGPSPGVAGTPDSGAASQFRLNYLRGDRSNEITTAGKGLYRARDGILGDIVDASPTWVGPPSSPYTAAWSDRLHPTMVMPENSGTPNNTQTYLQYITAEQGRLNVVYAGANDGWLHGFEAGSFDTSGNFCGTKNALITCAATPNDGKEVIAYMPGSTLYSPALSSTTGGCAGTNVSTGTAVQNIHGWTPAIGTGTSAVSCETPELDYSATPYGHNFFVDATPGTGDLFFNGAWHTWLVGGLGAGGAAIYALDITNPTATSTEFSELNAKNVVMGEWNSSTLTTCTSGTTVITSCGANLGNTYGTPQIRRLHNGNWAAIFGNGFGSTSGDAGIYIMLIDNPNPPPSTAKTPVSATFYYLSTNPSGTPNNAIFSGTGLQSGSVVTIKAVASITGASGTAATGAIAVGDVLTGAGVMPGTTVLSFGTGTGGTGTYNVSTSGTVTSGPVTVGNGIAYTTPADLDGDHITDYVYAGDLQGNMWRFDLTSATPGQWGVTNASGVSINKGGSGSTTPAPLFTASSSSNQIQRITTQPLVISNLVPGAGQFLLIEFGTGQRTQITNAAPESFLSGTQALYGVWDWNLSAWNAMSGTQYFTVAASTTGLASPFALGLANLTAQTLTPNASNGTVNGTNATICWSGTASCATGGNKSFGWYANLPGASEQIIFNPVFFQGAMLVNSSIPAVNAATSCTINTDTGFTYALNIANGGVFNNAFPTFSFTNPANNISTGTIADPTAAGVETNATGSVFVVNTPTSSNIVFQTVSGTVSGGTTGTTGTGTGIGTGNSTVLNVPTNTLAKRLTWVERR
jgi:type IV pilus assembly protein PilY1